MLIFKRYTGLNTEPIELGKAERFVLTDLKGDRYEYEPGRNIKDDIVMIHGWQEPMSTLGKIFQIQSGAIEKDVANLQIIIAALVHQMGGSVIIQPAEVEDAVKNLTLTNMHDKDFGFLVLKTEENQ